MPAYSLVGDLNGEAALAARFDRSMIGESSALTSPVSEMEGDAPVGEKEFLTAGCDPLVVNADRVLRPLGAVLLAALDAIIASNVDFNLSSESDRRRTVNFSGFGWNRGRISSSGAVKAVSSSDSAECSDDVCAEDSASGRGCARTDCIARP